MAKLDFNRLMQLTLAALSVGLVAVITVVLWQRSKMEYLTLAAGTSSGESYILGNALKTIVERHYPRIRITLLKTGGTVENLQMLEDGRAQLATAQADISPGPRARALAVLYDDTFQLLVPKDSQVQSLVDLRGQRIALAQSGGQYQSFLRVVEHFGDHGGNSGWNDGGTFAAGASSEAGAASGTGAGPTSWSAKLL
jgi:TRAP transporter TAXI family solute receptor